MKQLYQDGRHIVVARSGRQYCGLTAEEAERKYRLALCHAFKRKLGAEVVEELIASNYMGITSLGDLTIEQLRELSGIMLDACQYGNQMEKAQRLEPAISEKQRKRIIRLGKYVLGPRYGNTWFWKKLKEWTGKTKIDDLTNAEAHYMIKRLESIERRLSKGEPHGEAA